MKNRRKKKKEKKRKFHIQESRKKIWLEKVEERQNQRFIRKQDKKIQKTLDKLGGLKESWADKSIDQCQEEPKEDPKKAIKPGFNRLGMQDDSRTYVKEKKKPERDIKPGFDKSGWS